MNGPRRSFGLFLSHQSAYISLRKHFLLPYTFYRLNTLSIPPRTQIPQQFLSFSSVAIHAESVTPLSTPKFDLNSPILAKDALETIINSLSSSLKASKAMIAENIQRPWEGKCQLRDILKVIELFRNLSPSQRSQILSKLLQELPRCEQTAPFSLHDLCHSIASLRYISPNTDQLDNLIEILNRELLTKVSVSQLNHHDTNSLGLAVSGLCNLSSGNPHVLSLLSTLSNALESSLAVESVNIGNPIMDIDIVCRALSGLENCDSDSPAVRKIVKLLADQLREPFRTGRSLQSVENNTRDIDSMGEVLTGKQIQAAARGLKGLSSSHSECRALIGSLAGRLQSMWGTKDKLREPLTNPAAVTILSNLGNMELTEPVSFDMSPARHSH